MTLYKKKEIKRYIKNKAQVIWWDSLGFQGKDWDIWMICSSAIIYILHNEVLREMNK